MKPRGSRPSRSTASERSSAIGPKISATSAITSPTSTAASPRPSWRRLAIAASVEHRDSADSASATTRFTSSGIERLNERMPASTWASGSWAFPATSAPPSVVLVSPYTSTASGASSATSGSSPVTIAAVCLAWLPEPTPSS